MIVKFMGVLDLLAALFLILFQLEIVTSRVMLSFALYLFVKGVVFWGDGASRIDLILSIYMVSLLIWSPWILSIIAAIYLIQKAFFSLF